MKLTLITPALVALIGLALSGATVSLKADTTPASTTTSTSASSSSTKVKKTPYHGKVTAVDASGNTITVQGGKGKEPMKLMVSDKTKYKGASSLSDIAVGDTVGGSYIKDDSGMMMACTVHKKMAKSAAATQ